MVTESIKGHIECSNYFGHILGICMVKTFPVSGYFDFIMPLW
ncbi:hypothetical protein A33Q_1776 [Indibacter alkaliphilus LW1]|uniref:Uncharacterized protein n=1 Tax=Indibacter alkaliphilus (strain CCUG 57479 / KCTC 22604 / LW1) TaxID=1189612 RepID=S2E4H1_INDAL|nr:hypothetical protein A33Q_1776 [Indibacter alkaliphilus LW1]